ncbi:hypothetical protein [Burkholderia sp. Ax-1719]|uniref:hypothetical protein n=1 Tax=Burkholderia sp. Ax-1719 TaxID=2608334 RepID=UPI001420D0CF|nr:hypothetical protein [Burkholderia sp. Ax-1719]NIE63202.1 hypothetical protein [Burkholderia sp. Ax-1719]
MNTMKPKRPILVWVVFLYYLITVVPAAVGLLFVWHSASYSAQARTVINSMPPLFWTLLGLTMALQLGGAIALLRLRRIALPLFAGGLFVTILQWTMLHNEYAFSGAGSQGTYMGLFGLATEFLVCAYAWRLRSRSVLT